ncbi:hypothetical protein DAEQUDRAFT_733631 [Daedalea quercina L-15889]|uniref:Uncharacterized protein n=1 Tax=Daedalea quercina L-15889 TaxID=1314783 RepID=A0A165KV63_9APHY|nr:hypothetical protein DAEQUDRAFT_733631 [Daedalea quercina L-15889]
MLTHLSGLLALLYAFAATATPHVWDKPPATVAVTRKFNFTGGSTFVEMDRARVQSLFSHKC